MPGQQPAVKMVPVDGRILESVGYVMSTRKLFVKYHEQPMQCFENVPGFRYQGLLEAPRKDAYFKSFIKDRFLVKEVPPPPAA